MRRCNSRLSVSTLRRVQTIYGRPQNNKGVFTPSWLIALQPLDASRNTANVATGRFVAQNCSAHLVVFILTVDTQAETMHGLMDSVTSARQSQLPPGVHLQWV